MSYGLSIVAEKVEEAYKNATEWIAADLWRITAAESLEQRKRGCARPGTTVKCHIDTRCPGLGISPDLRPLERVMCR